MGSMDFRTEQRQTQTLSPRLQHAVRLLQLSSLEFAQQVHDALGKNPFLEEDGNPDDMGDDNLSPEQAAEAQEAREAQEAAADTMAAPGSKNTKAKSSEKAIPRIKTRSLKDPRSRVSDGADRCFALRTNSAPFHRTKTAQNVAT